MSEVAIEFRGSSSAVCGCRCRWVGDTRVGVRCVIMYQTMTGAGACSSAPSAQKDRAQLHCPARCSGLGGQLENPSARCLPRPRPFVVPGPLLNFKSFQASLRPDVNSKHTNHPAPCHVAYYPSLRSSAFSSLPFTSLHPFSLPASRHSCSSPPGLPARRAARRRQSTPEQPDLCRTKEYTTTSSYELSLIHI